MKAVGDKVIIEVIHEKQKTDGGLYIPNFEEKLYNEGIVLTTGDKVSKLNEGDRVMFNEYDGTKLPKDDENPTKTFIVMRETQVIGIIKEKKNDEN